MANPVPGFPDETNTGVQSGVTLKTYTGPMTIKTSGTVIENMIIKGSLKIEASNVTIKNCIIEYNGWWGIDASRGPGITVQNCEIIGPGNGGDSNAGILGSGTFLNNNIYHSENGIVLQDGASIVRGNFIHDLRDGGRDPHYDGISVQGGQDGVIIEGNTVISRDTSNIFIKNDFGPIKNVTVRNNLLYGDAGYVIYVDGNANGGSITNVTIADNYIEKGYYGLYSVVKSNPTITGNTVFTPGDAVQVPKPTPSPTPTPSPSPEPTPTPNPGTDVKETRGTNKDDVIKGTNADDKIYGRDGNDKLYGEGGRDTLYGDDGNDMLFGGDGADTLYGGRGADVLDGGSGNDKLFGGAGKDKLIGGLGADVLVGNEGADIFVFKSIADSTVASSGRDTILDFSRKQGDKIDLQAIDAQTGWGDQAFNFIGESRFTNKKGELRYSKMDGDTYVYGDVNGDGVSDFAIKLVGTVDLKASDFML